MAKAIERGFNYTETATFYAADGATPTNLSGVTVRYCVKNGSTIATFTPSLLVNVASVELTAEETTDLRPTNSATTYWTLTIGSTVTKRGEVKRKIL